MDQFAIILLLFLEQETKAGRTAVASCIDVVEACPLGTLQTVPNGPSKFVGECSESGQQNDHQLKDHLSLIAHPSSARNIRTEALADSNL